MLKPDELRDGPQPTDTAILAYAALKAAVMAQAPLEAVAFLLNACTRLEHATPPDADFSDVQYLVAAALQAAAENDRSPLVLDALLDALRVLENFRGDQRVTSGA